VRAGGKFQKAEKASLGPFWRKLLTASGSLGGVKPFWYDAKRCWAVDIPRRLSPTGKRQRKFFPNRDKAHEFCGDHKEEHAEHGKASVTGYHCHP